MLGFALAAIAVFLVFGYFGLPLLAWTVAAGRCCWYLSVVADFGPVTNVVLAIAVHRRSPRC